MDPTVFIYLYFSLELKIHFLEVLELVKTRKTFLKGGFAYLTISEFGSVLAHVFRTRLSKSLAVRFQIVSNSIRYNRCNLYQTLIFRF